MIDDHLALVSILRMACALEPYLRAYTADLHPRYILEFLLFDEDFPRSIRYSTTLIEEHLTHLSKGREIGRGDPLRLAGRLNARLTYTDVEDVEATGASAILNSVEAECSTIHRGDVRDLRGLPARDEAAHTDGAPTWPTSPRATTTMSRCARA